MEGNFQFARILFQPLLMQDFLRMCQKFFKFRLAETFFPGILIFTNFRFIVFLFCFGLFCFFVFAVSPPSLPITFLMVHSWLDSSHDSKNVIYFLSGHVSFLFKLCMVHQLSRLLLVQRLRHDNLQPGCILSPSVQQQTAQASSFYLLKGCSCHGGSTVSFRNYFVSSNL